MNKSQMNTHFKLARLEGIVLQKISIETSTLKSFLKALTTTTTTVSYQSVETAQQQQQTFNPLIIEILSKALTNNASLDPWLKAISIEENSKDKCILNADKSQILANLKSNRLALNSLINRVVATYTASSEENQQHVSISVYHFITIQNLIDANPTQISLLNEQLECLQENPSKWVSEINPAFVQASLKEKFFCEVIIVSLVHKAILERCQDSKAAVGKFIESVSGVDITRTVEVVLSLVLETLLGFNLKSKPSGADIEVLKFLKETLTILSSKNVSLNSFISYNL